MTFLSSGEGPNDSDQVSTNDPFTVLLAAQYVKSGSRFIPAACASAKVSSIMSVFENLTKTFLSFEMAAFKLLSHQFWL